MCFKHELSVLIIWSDSSSSRQFYPLLYSLFPLFIQYDRCLFPFPTWGLMAGLPEFASHGSSLHLGAGYNVSTDFEVVS